MVAEVTLTVFHVRERPVPEVGWLLGYVNGHWQRGFRDRDKFFMGPQAWWPVGMVQAWCMLPPEDLDRLRG